MTAVYQTIAAAKAATIIEPRCYLMDRKAYMVKAATNPSHALKFQSVGGQWWEPEWHGEALVEWGGAVVGDDEANAVDNRTAIQNVINYVEFKGGGTVTFGPGIYCSNGLVVDEPGVVLRGCRPTDTWRPSEGGDMHGTILRVISTGGDGIRLKASECDVVNIAIYSGEERAAMPYGGTRNGIRLEADDSPGMRVTSATLHNVLVRDQPGNGIMFAGLGVSNTMSHVTAIANKGHGILFDGGDHTARVNKDRPGIIEIVQARTTDNDGHGICVGHPSTGTNGTVPYRVNLVNCEAYRNAKSASVRHQASNHYLVGENITMDHCAASGYTTDELKPNPDLSAVWLAGVDIRVEGNRLLSSKNPIVRIGSVSGLTNRDIRIAGNRSINNGDPADYFVQVSTGGPTTYGLMVLDNGGVVAAGNGPSASWRYSDGSIAYNPS
ncbi:hypothetical protein DLJ53_09285 [Acuticoccus sediminis]|uniref:Parallel beta helix pectate lyase-like protein n=1 Tax=Acuticoccus sediminis TaxID=2184697 RepID=A0A8B2NNZ1_9HYPH|nr:hypothetical protein [Acuticoccus sediminis]RAI01605.1 hypothetical protein DLJ53_09285 [Acuticoccus sediminis]